MCAHAYVPPLPSLCFESPVQGLQEAFCCWVMKRREAVRQVLLLGNSGPLVVPFECLSMLVYLSAPLPEQIHSARALWQIAVCDSPAHVNFFHSSSSVSPSFQHLLRCANIKDLKKIELQKFNFDSLMPWTITSADMKCVTGLEYQLNTSGLSSQTHFQ